MNSYLDLLVGLQEPAALAAVALIGYLFGRRTSAGTEHSDDGSQSRGLKQAKFTAQQLEDIAATLRKELASHHSQLSRFNRRLSNVRGEGDKDKWDAIASEAEAMLEPTLQLARQLSQAYDEIRKQSKSLPAVSDARVDPVTGVGNGRAVQEAIDAFLKEMASGGKPFSIALFGIDTSNDLGSSSESDEKDSSLKDLATLIKSMIRDGDFIARYGKDEFVVIMPETDATAGNVICEKMRSCIASDMGVTVCCGVTEATIGDTHGGLMARADSALYSAKASGTNRQFVHTGRQIREHHSPVSTPLPTDRMAAAVVGCDG